MISPMSILIIVDLPAPLTPMTATREALEHARVGEGEGDVLGLELVVGSGLGHELDELG